VFQLMSFDVDEDTVIGDYKGICPKCGTVMTFWHDIRCVECDQRFVNWCPKCLDHRRLRL